MRRASQSPLRPVVILGLIAALGACATPAPPPPPPPPPPPVEKVPFRPIPPMGAAYVMDVPPLGPDGRRITVISAPSTDERVWYFRSAWNVAALNCTGAIYKPVLDGYAAYLKKNVAALKAVNSRIDASYRKEYAVARDAIKAREKTMTTVYNYFTLPPVRGSFCQAALAVTQAAPVTAKYDGIAFANAQFAALEKPFDEFFAAYERYQQESSAWDVQYGPRYGASQPGYLATQAARRSTSVPQAGVSDPTRTTAAKTTTVTTVTDPDSGAQIPVVPVQPGQGSVPVVQPVAKTPPKN